MGDEIVTFSFYIYQIWGFVIIALKISEKNRKNWFYFILENILSDHKNKTVLVYRALPFLLILMFIRFKMFFLNEYKYILQNQYKT